jgi:hypothetical protein
MFLFYSVGITKQDIEHAIRSKVDGTDDGTFVLPLQTRIGYLTKARVWFVLSAFALVSVTHRITDSCHWMILFS